MAPAPTATTGQKGSDMADEKMVQIPKEELEQMKVQMAAMAEQIKRLTSAQLAGAGMDPKIAARAEIGHSLVQFTAEYNRGAIPSETQKGAIVYPGYTVSTGQIVLLKDDEIERLSKDRPELIITNKKDFKPQGIFGYKMALDKKTGKPKREKVEEQIPVEDLIKSAVEVG